MELKGQVCNLELARKLKELGVKQDSPYSWSWAIPSRGKTLEQRLALENQTEPEIYPSSTFWGECFDTASAFTVAELGEMLPHKIRISEELAFIRLKLFDDEPHCEIYYVDTYTEKMVFPKDQSIRGITEADARASMLVYLMEENRVDMH